MKSNNKSKTTWNIIKEISGHNHQKINMQDIKIEHKNVTDPKEIACIFNNYFTVKNNKGTRMRQKVDKKTQNLKIIILIPMVSSMFPT